MMEGSMRASSIVFLSITALTASVTTLHLGLNGDWASWKNDRLPEDERKLNVAYIPVT
jgi:NitT/TauT family transport system substrate-binding protein